MKRILITGAGGQIGSELTRALRDRYGIENVIASDIRTEPNSGIRDHGEYEILDCTDAHRINKVVRQRQVGTIYHLAAILSAVAEENPQLAWHVNMNGLYNVLETAREHKCHVFYPSSIGVFGPTTPVKDTPQEAIQRPTTMYGVTKVSGELLCDYFFRRYGVDTRGLRYPGLISHQALPGGGTTDYAVDIYYGAIQHGQYTCYLSENTYLDMLYMPDAIRAAIELMEADYNTLIHRNAFNVTAMSVSPRDIAAEIRKIIPEFAVAYEIDAVRQQIADSWPDAIDDSAAREEWGWQPEYDLQSTTNDMIRALGQRFEERQLCTNCRSDQRSKGGVSND
jgi:nucleoside-diphosphate-sugar epimerase